MNPELLNDADAARLNQRGADWLTKQQAADALGVSTRTVQQLASEGKLRTLKRAVEGGAPIAIYDPDDVAKEREKRAKLEVMAPAKVDGGQSISRPLEQIVAALLARPGQSPLDDPPMNLTLAEASAASGLPASYLREAVAYGALPAHRWGKRGQHMRIHREDLAAFRGQREKPTAKPTLWNDGKAMPLAQPQWSEGGTA